MATKKTTKKTTTKKTATAQSYVIARCHMAGLHAGYLVSETVTHITLRDARRIWYWNGAASISEIAVYGLNPAKRDSSRIGCKLSQVRLLQSDTYELVLCEDAGRECLESMPEWRA